MEGKRESFFKRNQFTWILILSGILFFTALKRWDLYEKPLMHLGGQLEEFLGMELFGWESEGAGEDGREAQENPRDGQNGDRGENGDGTPKPGAEDLQGADDESGQEEWENLPEWITVEESYFDDALFIGDSRIVGLRDYGKLEEHATFYASEGLNIFRLLNSRIVEVEGQRKKITVEEALGERQFGKIYLMVGINELDIGTVERYKNTYQETIERIRELQPNARIYIQSIMLVTEKRAAKGDFVTNAGIRERNEAIQGIADNENVFYLDVNEAVVDESGGMNPEYTTDGVHLKAKYVPLWKEYIKTHVKP